MEGGIYVIPATTKTVKILTIACLSKGKFSKRQGYFKRDDNYLGTRKAVNIYFVTVTKKRAFFKTSRRDEKDRANQTAPEDFSLIKTISRH